ncbi:pentapeptide repeat-containing protein [Nonomuraea angiospora]|uniref:pentapeptide repeat-containing protein n=1 Tax=Nonomuraea angiospora TaxID=46172 RepID=UPI0033F6CC74
MRHAYLVSADLRGADMVDADLRGADLRAILDKTEQEIREAAVVDSNTLITGASR